MEEYEFESIEDVPEYEFESIDEPEKFDLSPYQKRAASDAEDVREGLKAVGSGLVSWIPAGLSMFSFDTRGLVERAKTAKDIQESLTYEPKTEGGRKIAEYAAKPFEWMAEAGIKGGEYLEEKGFPALGAVSRFAGEAAPFGLPGVYKAGKVGVRGAKTKLKALEEGMAFDRPIDSPTMRPVPIPEEVMATRGVPVGEPFGPEPTRAERIKPVEEQKLLPEARDYVFEELTEKPVAETLPEAKVVTPVEEIVQPAPTSGGKQPWEMTRAEFGNSYAFHATKEVNLPSIIENGVTKGSWAVGNVKGFPGDKLLIVPQSELTARGAAPSKFGAWNLLEPEGTRARKYTNPIPADKITIIDKTDNPHEALIRQALSEGKPVPPEVLKDYPDLFPSPLPEAGAGKLSTKMERVVPEFEPTVSSPLAPEVSKQLEKPVVPEKVVEVVATEKPFDPQMRYQWSEIDQAIAKAPTIEDRFIVEKLRSKWVVRDKESTAVKDSFKTKDEAIRDAKERWDKLEDIDRTKPTIEIVSPNGATFRIPNTKENLTDFAARVKREFPGKQSSTLFGGIPDPTQFPGVVRELGKSLKSEWENLESTSPMAKSVGEKVGKTVQVFREGFLDPERVLKADPTGRGKEIFKTLATAEESKNAFLEPRLNEFVRQTKGIDTGSAASERVGKALDGKLDSGNLNPSELKAYDHLKSEYDFLIKEFARRAAGSEEAYNKVLQKAANKHEAKVKIEELDGITKAEYKSLSDESAKIRGGRRLGEMSKEAKDQYWDKRQQMSDTLHNEWLKRLSPGEAEAYNILSRKIKDYLPHLFDREELVDMFRKEIGEINNKLRTATDNTAINGFKSRLKELESSVTKLSGGNMVTYSELPRNIRFRFFETRKGKEGYSYDAIKAYQAYLYGISKKMFDEQAVRTVRDLYKDMDPSLKPYTKDLVNNYMGWNKNSLDWLAGTISSFEWIRTLGLNPRSALVNLTQRINTAVYAGEKYALKAEKMLLLNKDQANAIFEKSGIAREVPKVLTEGPMPQGMERARAIAGFMFHKVELGNRKHAYLSGYLKAIEKGMTEEQAIKAGTKTVHKTQFRYGKLGMPQALRHPIGRVALQFTSYPLKQSQFLWDLVKKDPIAAVKYIAYAEGINYSLKQFFDVDLSNALGFGVNWGEAFDAVRDLAKGDMRGVYRHGKQAFQKGGGLLPSGLGPAVSGAMNVVEKSKEGKGFKQFLKELKPVIANRIEQAYDAAKEETKGMYPIKDSSGHVMYKLSARQLIQRTIGPKTSKEAESSRDYEARTNLEQERREVLGDITKAIIDGDKQTAKKLVERYHVFPSNEAIEREIINRKFTKEEQRKFGVREQYQIMREGRIY